MLRSAGGSDDGIGIVQGYLSQLLGQMAVSKGTQQDSEARGTAADDNLTSLDLPPGEMIDRVMDVGAAEIDGPHAGTAESDEDEYQIYEDDEEEGEEDDDGAEGHAL